MKKKLTQSFSLKSYLTLSFFAFFSTISTAHAFETSGVILPDNSNPVACEGCTSGAHTLNIPTKGNTNDLIPPDKIPHGVGGDGGFTPGKGDYPARLYECIANNTNCTVFWV